MPFSSKGIGAVIKRSLDRNIGELPFASNKNQSSPLFGFADFSGEHKSAKYETFSFLFSNGRLLQHWFDWQNSFRVHSDMENRRMAFKSLNDSKRRNALASFLRAASGIHGVLFNVALPRKSNSVFTEVSVGVKDDPFRHWKSRIARKVVNINSFGAYFAAGLSNPNQDILLFFDEDAITGNTLQHQKLTKLLASQILAHSPHNLGNFRLGTSQSDNGSLQLEDTLAIADLAAGAYSELLSTMSFPSINGNIAAFCNPSKRPSEKTNAIGRWLIEPSKQLEVLNLLFLPKVDGGFHALFLSTELGMRLHI